MSDVEPNARIPRRRMVEDVYGPHTVELPNCPRLDGARLGNVAEPMAIRQATLE